jgi:hypothetical protein
MPLTCTICRSNRRDEIDAELIANATFRDIARRYRVGKDALSRHKRAHLLVKLRMAEEKRTAELAKREILSIDRLANELKMLIGLTHEALQKDRHNPQLLALQNRNCALLVQIHAPVVALEPADPVRLKVVYTKVTQALEEGGAVEIEGQPYRGEPETKPSQVLAAEIVKPHHQPPPSPPPRPALPPHREPEANLLSVTCERMFDWRKPL